MQDRNNIQYSNGQIPLNSQFPTQQSAVSPSAQVSPQQPPVYGAPIVSTAPNAPSAPTIPTQPVTQFAQPQQLVNSVTTEQPQLVQQYVEQPMPADQPVAMEQSYYGDQMNSTSDLPDNVVQWQASDFIKHERSSNWYLAAGGIFFGVLIICILAFVFHFLSLFSLISIVVVLLLMFIAIFMSGKIPHRQINYTLTPSELHVDEKVLSLGDFRAFGVRNNGSVWQVVLIPTNRFGMETAIYIDESVGEQVVDILGSTLPMIDMPDSLIDKVNRALKI